MATENITLITAIVGGACGLLGAVLGIINTWNQMRKNKIRLKVTPIHAIPVGSLSSANIDFGIEVINLSDFAVTITDVGFLLESKQTATLATVNSIEQPSKLPIRLEPRTSYRKYFSKSVIDTNGARIKSAYANTECGETITGVSGALKQLIKEVKA